MAPGCLRKGSTCVTKMGAGVKQQARCPNRPFQILVTCRSFSATQNRPSFRMITGGSPDPSRPRSSRAGPRSDPPVTARVWLAPLALAVFLSSKDGGKVGDEQIKICIFEVCSNHIILPSQWMKEVAVLV